MTLTYIGLKPRDVEKVRTACLGIRSADPTFGFSIVRSSIRKYSNLLMVKSDDVDRAHKRGVWLVNKLGIDGLLYWVK